MAILDELKGIEERDGILHPQAVVDFARDPNTELHKKFEWNNKKAGEQYRLWQARQLISVQVTYLHAKENNLKVPAYISLSDDRYADGGYRSVVSILSDEEYRAKMLKDAKRDFLVFRRKYQALTELAKAFDEIERVLA